MVSNTEELGYEGLVDQEDDRRSSLSLLIGGVHCALCIQKIESALIANPAVQNARLNFSTGRLNVIWAGAHDLANEFVQAIINLGYTVQPFNPDMAKNAQDQQNRFLLLCLGIAGFAMGNIMLLSVGLWITSVETMGGATRELLHWLSALIAIPAIIFAGRPFFTSAYAALKSGGTNMDVPISVALILATGMSLFETVNGGEHVYFDSAVMLMFFLLIGRYLDFKARRTAKSAATDLLQTLSGFATVIEGDKPKRTLIRDLREGMRVMVATGENVPIDGIVENGMSEIDTSLVTGETLPRPVQTGDEVFAGTLNQSAPLTITVSKPSDKSLLADVVRLMEQAEQGQARYVRLADRAARFYTPIVHVLAAAAFILWWGVWGAAWQDALMVAVTVLIITCPCALGLAVPVVQVLASGLLMKRGVLLKSGDALERLAGINAAIFDKTGTLTIGKPSLIGDYNESDLKLAASLAQHSAHPLSKALCSNYDSDLISLKDIKEVPGKGLSATHKDQTIKLGSRSWCGDDNAPISEDLEIWLSIDDTPKTAFHFSDTLREDAADIILELQTQNIPVTLLSGDRESAVKNIAEQLKIETVLAEQTPIEKYDYMQPLKTDGARVLMVGDGLNDAPVLAAADVSMAPGSAIDMAQNAADIVFMGDKLAPVAFTHKIAKHAQSLVKQNFTLAIAYNCIAVPLAFSGLVTPMIAALAMSGSSLLVIANSFRLKLNA